MVSSKARRFTNRRNKLCSLHKLQSRSLNIHGGALVVKTSPANFVLTSMKIMDRCAVFSTKEIVRTFLSALICNAHYCPLEHCSSGRSTPLSDSPKGSVTSVSQVSQMERVHSSVESLKTDSLSLPRLNKKKMNVTLPDIIAALRLQTPPRVYKATENERKPYNMRYDSRKANASSPNLLVSSGDPAEKILRVLRQRVVEKCNTCASSSQAESLSSSVLSQQVLDKKDSISRSSSQSRCEQSIDPKTPVAVPRRVEVPRCVTSASGCRYSGRNLSCTSGSKVPRNHTNVAQRVRNAHRTNDNRSRGRLPLRNVKSATGARIACRRTLETPTATSSSRFTSKSTVPSKSGTRPLLSASASAPGKNVSTRPKPCTATPLDETRMPCNRPHVKVSYKNRPESAQASDVRKIMKIIRQKQPRYVTLSVSVFTRILKNITKGLPKLKIVQPSERSQGKSPLTRSLSATSRHQKGKHSVSPASRKKLSHKMTRSASHSFKESQISSISLPRIPQKNQRNKEGDCDAEHVPVIFVSTIQKSKLSQNIPIAIGEDNSSKLKSANEKEPVLLVQTSSSNESDQSPELSGSSTVENSLTGSQVEYSGGSRWNTSSSSVRNIHVLIQSKDVQQSKAHAVTSSDSSQSLTRPPTSSTSNEDTTSVTVSRSACTQKILSRNVWECLKAQQSGGGGRSSGNGNGNGNGNGRANGRLART